MLQLIQPVAFKGKEKQGESDDFRLPGPEHLSWRFSTLHLKGRSREAACGLANKVCRDNVATKIPCCTDQSRMKNVFIVSHCLGAV
jgi:hypothetical protein